MRVRLARTRVSGCVVTCHPAEQFPIGVYYDRVLCDVPCSGDGTLRKNPDIWGSWQPMFSATLHPLQVAILSRGLQILRPGGQLVYSTCSFSPVEGEAVLAAVLQSEHGAGVELVEVNGVLPGLRSTPGVSSWRVTAAADGSGLGSWDEATEERRTKWRLTPSLFPPSEEITSRLCLHRAMRVLPHHNDTGGFFVALLKKAAGAPTAAAAAATTSHNGGSLGPIAPPTEATETADRADVTDGELEPSSLSIDAVELAPELTELVEAIDDDDENERGGAANEKLPAAVAEELHRRLCFTAVGESSDLAAELREFYGLGDSFPFGQLFSTYAQTTSRRLYLTSASAARALLNTPSLRVRVVGIKAFEKDESLGVPCGFRIAQDGALHLLPYLGKRLLRVTAETFAAVLEAKTIDLPVTDGSGEPRPPQTHTTSTLLDQFATRLSALWPNGSCVVACDNGDGRGVGSARCALCLMKYSEKAVLFVSEGERLSMLDDLRAYHSDPLLCEQLRPLTTPELARRAAALGIKEPLLDNGREVMMAAAVRAMSVRPRREVFRCGAPVPAALRAALLLALHTLHWPASSARPGVTAEHYLVLNTRRTNAELGTRHPHYALREACDAVLHWYRASCSDSAFEHTAIAVTKNFVGSAHIDAFDRSPQLALALGDFEGGALCVESNDGLAIDVFDTRDKIAKVDGRRVHWVRRFSGGDRFSLIWYNTVE